MKATSAWLGALLGAVLLTSSAQAQCCYLAPPRAPDMLNPGFYYANCYGQVYGPNYCVYPPFAPFQGMIWAPPTGPQGPGGGHGPLGASFPTHPYARSPRDFFMIDFDGGANPYGLGSVTPGPSALPPLPAALPAIPNTTPAPLPVP